MLLNSLFNGIFDSSSALPIAFSSFMLCLAFAILAGLIIAIAHTYKARYTKSFVVTLALLPSVVCMVIMMVNGNLGAGVAVAGTFSLVRFRSVPGTAKEIGAIFLAMGSGLAIGMGYLVYAMLFTLIVTAFGLICAKFGFGGRKPAGRSMRITIPENLDYTGAFDDLFLKYTNGCELLSVKTASMGSLIKLSYDVTLANVSDEKAFIDDLRCRNGNLEIIMARESDTALEL